MHQLVASLTDYIILIWWELIWINIEEGQNCKIVLKIYKSEDFGKSIQRVIIGSSLLLWPC